MDTPAILYVLKKKKCLTLLVIGHLRLKHCFVKSAIYIVVHCDDSRPSGKKKKKKDNEQKNTNRYIYMSSSTESYESVDRLS